MLVTYDAIWGDMSSTFVSSTTTALSSLAVTVAEEWDSRGYGGGKEGPGYRSIVLLVGVGNLRLPNNQAKAVRDVVKVFGTGANTDLGWHEAWWGREYGTHPDKQACPGWCDQFAS